MAVSSAAGWPNIFYSRMATPIIYEAVRHNNSDMMKKTIGK